MLNLRDAPTAPPPTRYQRKRPTMPIFFVDPATGEVLELNLDSVKFTK